MRLRPSERSRWEHCSGYPAFRDLLASEGALPEEAPSPYAWRGTVAHAVLAELLERYAQSKWPKATHDWALDPSESLAWLLEQRGRSFVEPETEQTCVVDEDMIADVAFCALAVADKVREMGPGTSMYVELHVGGDDVSAGTADVVLTNASASRKAIVDAKFGTGIDVPIEGNLQLRTYAVLHKAPAAESRVDLAIIQPRKGGVKASQHDLSELKAWDASLVEAQRRCHNPQRRLAAGSWCRWCPCADACPAMGKVIEEAVAYAAVPESGTAPSGAVLGERLRVFDVVLKPYAKSLSERLLRGLEEGVYDDSSGWKRVAKRALRAWRDEDEVVAWFTEQGYGRAELYTAKLKTPAQLEKHLNGAAKEAMSGLVVKESSGFTLAPVADKRRKEAPLVALGPFPGSS